MHFVKYPLLSLLVCLCSITACAQNAMIKQHSIPNSISDHYRNKGFELLSVYQFNNITADSWLHELSGLAWDYDEKRLYSVTDGGQLISFNIDFNNNEIMDIQLISHYPLQDAIGNNLSGKQADSEGLALHNHNNGVSGDTELLISFERTPRVVRYRPDGTFITAVKIPANISDPTRFNSGNNQLEALTEHSLHGLLVGPERPLDKIRSKIQIFNQQKQVTQLILHDAESGSLVGLTTLPDNNVVALERVFVNVFTGLQFHLHLLQTEPSGFTQTTLFSSAVDDGYLNDNFEGITHHKDNYFFMVSDDNENAYQRTLLIYFRLSELKL